jgi:hypothetical protein
VQSGIVFRHVQAFLLFQYQPDSLIEVEVVSYKLKETIQVSVNAGSSVLEKVLKVGTF